MAPDKILCNITIIRLMTFCFNSTSNFVQFYMKNILFPSFLSYLRILKSVPTHSYLVAKLATNCHRFTSPELLSFLITCFAASMDCHCDTKQCVGHLLRIHSSRKCRFTNRCPNYAIQLISNVLCTPNTLLLENS